MIRIIPFLLTILLTACGGGSSDPDSGLAIDTRLARMSYDSNYSFIPNVAIGDLTGDGKSYAVVAGWYAKVGGTSMNPSPSVKIYLLESDKIVDVTAQILGSEFSASVNFPLVADFNGDGIDDIWFAGFTDAPAYDFNPSYVFLSRRGEAHQKTDLPGLTWNHSVAAVDLDLDGDLDVVNSHGQIWKNNSGTFDFIDHTYNSSPPYWMHGSGVCAGDFNNSGRPQLVITDLYVDGNMGPVSDTVIFELNSLLRPVNAHNLPRPFLDQSSVNEQSHDVACVVADLNNDNLLDIVVISALDSAEVKQGLKPSEHAMQVYLNQGNFVFVDATESYYKKPILSSYVPKILDHNSDGHMDIWLSSWSTTAAEANVLWHNNGSGLFVESQTLPMSTLRNSISSMAQGTRPGFIVPVRLNNSWFYLASNLTDNMLNIGIIKH